MPFRCQIGAVGLGVLSVVQVTPSFAWDYSSTNWTGNCSASVANQSPIDITVATAVESSTRVPPLAFDFNNVGFPDSATTAAIEAGLVVNNHTWELEWDEANAAENPYGITVGDKFYRLAQFHYHSPSEHTVNGQHYDMEAHHVHFCEGVSCETTDNPNDEILVVAVFMRVGEENSYLQQFWNQFHQPPAAEPAISNVANPYTDFMPPDKSYYYYVGSTTTPPCAQNVQWRLLEQPVEMSADQLTAYHTSINLLPQPSIPLTPAVGVSAVFVNSTKGNNRPLQEIGSRQVFHFKAPDDSDADGQFPSWLLPLLIGLAVVGLVAAFAMLYLHQNSNKAGKTRGVKPVKKPSTPARREAAPKEETVPLVPPPAAPPPMLAAPNLSMVVQPQPFMQAVQGPPLMQAVPQAFTTVARPFGQAPVLQP